jgi:predicted transcriptional regulator
MSRRNRKEVLFTIRLDKDLYNRLKDVARIEVEGNVSMAVREAIREFIDNHRK